jgi:hypothetical protein
MDSAPKACEIAPLCRIARLKHQPGDRRRNAARSSHAVPVRLSVRRLAAEDSVSARNYYPPATSSEINFASTSIRMP